MKIMSTRFSSRAENVFVIAKNKKKNSSRIPVASLQYYPNAPVGNLTPSYADVVRSTDGSVVSQ